MIITQADGRAAGETNRWIVGELDQRMDKRTDGRTDGRKGIFTLSDCTDEQMDKQTDR